MSPLGSVDRCQQQPETGRRPLTTPTTPHLRQLSLEEYKIGVPELSRRWALLVLFTIVYYTVGCLYYKFGSDLDWNILQAVYFTTISITTIGYGDEVPYTDQDRVFTMVYIAVGILLVMNSIAQAVSAFFETLQRASMRRRALRKATRGGRRQSSRMAQFCYRELSWFFWVVFMIIGGAVVIYKSEGYSFVDSMFWAFQTCTTIGYGNERIQTRGVRAFVVPYALFSSIGWAYVIAKMVGTSADAAYQRRREALLEARLDHALIMCLARDGTGIDKADFIVGMLRILGHVTDEDVEPWYQRFDDLDKNGTGRLDASDVAVIAREAAIQARRHSAAREVERRSLFGGAITSFIQSLRASKRPTESMSDEDGTSSSPLYTPFITPRGRMPGSVAPDESKDDPIDRSSTDTHKTDHSASFADPGRGTSLGRSTVSPLDV